MRRLPPRSFLLLLFFALGASRRWGEFTCPQVWCEDWVVIQNFAAHGWGSLLMPLNGYLVVAPRLLTGVALAVSLPWYPLVSAVLATGFSALVGLAVARAPTQLRGRLGCAIALFFVPCDPEVFGLPLYALWWAPVLLFLVALWEEGDSWLGLRLLFVALAGLSSPLILVVLPVLALRAALRPREWTGWLVALVAAGTAAAQLHWLGQEGNMAAPPWPSVTRHVLPKFCGWYVAGNFSESPALLWGLGLGLVALLLAALAVGWRRAAAWVLAYLWLGSVAVTVLRVDPAILHPERAGPRDFFIPFLLASWMLLQLASAVARPWLRAAVAATFACSVVNALPVWSRGQVDMDWGAETRSACHFPSYRVPIEYDGRWERAWNLYLPRGQWLNLADRTLARQWFGPDRGPTFPYRVIGPAELPAPPSDREATVAFAPGAGRPAPLRLSPRGRIQFRSGAWAEPIPVTVVGREQEFVPKLPVAADWVTLEFSNELLGSDFALQVGRPGGPVGEWRPAP